MPFYNYPQPTPSIPSQDTSSIQGTPSIGARIFLFFYIMGEDEEAPCTGTGCLSDDTRFLLSWRLFDCCPWRKTRLRLRHPPVSSHQPPENLRKHCVCQKKHSCACTAPNSVSGKEKQMIRKISSYFIRMK